MQTKMENGIVLTINQNPALGKPVSNTASKAVKSRILCSPFEKCINGQYVTPKGLYTALNNFKEREKLTCTKKLSLSPDCYHAWSKEAPYPYNAKIWAKLPTKAKIELFAKSFDEGFGVSFEIL